MANNNPLISLDEAGTSVWLDYIRRKLVASGELQHMVDEDGLRGMTSNPTIFEKAISGSTDYDLQVKDLVQQGLEPLRIFQVIATDDIRDACDTLMPIYDRLNKYDGYVSIEVSPGSASDTEETIAEGRDLWKLVHRPNVMIKVPGTDAGLPGIEQLISEGINVNITLLFSVDNYVQVAERYIRGLERRLEAGQPIDHVASVASFFVSRVDTAVDKQLQTKIDASSDDDDKDRLRGYFGKAAIANAKLAYERFERIFSGPRWEKLASAGAMVQRPLWASTSTKNPQYRDVMYVEELIGPHTVNTMPQATMNAFKDHGVVHQTLTEGLDDARKLFRDLATIGIHIEEITRQLQIDGVGSFAQSFDELIDCIDSERTAISIGLERSESESLGQYQAAVETELENMGNNQFVRRLWEKDGSLWTDDEAEQAGIKNALGWMNIVETMQEHLPQLEQFAQQVRADGFRDAVVLGMGGSSLCPDVLAHTFESEDGFPLLSILDTTDPAAVESLTERLPLKETLFIVSSKSGTTAEPLAFYHYFWNKVKDAGVADPARQFVAITDPGTPLEAEARNRGFRSIFAGAPDIGGRYSALSNFGMVPAAVMGVNVRELLSRAETMVHACQPCVGPAENPAVRLGAIIGVLAREGRDKLTLSVSPAIGTFGWWVEQLIAESTGKSGTGILPVEDERLADPAVYGQDRLFVGLRMRDESSSDGQSERLTELERAGQPVVVLELKDKYDVGGEFLLWELATATAGSILHINAFNQPNVQESKDNTNRLLSEFETTRKLAEPEVALADGDLRISGPAEPASTSSQYLEDFLSAHVKTNSYVAIMAYVNPTDEHSRLVNTFRLSIRDRFHVATTVGYGPRFLHSTGQFHKGGPDEGVFIQIVGHEPTDVDIEGQPFSFGTLIAAQSLGDYQALKKHERPVVRLDLGSDISSGLDKLASTFAGAPV